MKRCHCCGSKTILERGEFEICPVCFWEDGIYWNFEELDINEIELNVERLLDIPSPANNQLTLRQARINYSEFGACERDFIKSVRLPKDDEI